MAFVEAHGIAKTYTSGEQPLPILKDLNLSVDKGTMVAIVGASGVGKSTLLHVLGGLDRANEGSVTIGDAQVTSLDDAEIVAFRNAHVGFVFQLIQIPADVYQVSHVPFTVLPLDFALVVLGAIVVCFFATIYPSRQAARLDPAQALRNE